MITIPNTRQTLGATVVTPDWNKLSNTDKQRWTFNIHTDSQNTTSSITQVNNSSVILSQTFDPFGNTLVSKLNLGSLSNPLIKTKDDLLNLNIPIPGWQGSSQSGTNTFDFGRRQYTSTTGQFSSVDPVAGGVSYDAFFDKTIWIFEIRCSTKLKTNICQMNTNQSTILILLMK